MYLIFFTYSYLRQNLFIVTCYPTSKSITLSYLSQLLSVCPYPPHTPLFTFYFSLSYHPPAHSPPPIHSIIMQVSHSKKLKYFKSDGPGIQIEKHNGQTCKQAEYEQYNFLVKNVSDYNSGRLADHKCQFVNYFKLVGLLIFQPLWCYLMLNVLQDKNRNESIRIQTWVRFVPETKRQKWVQLFFFLLFF